MNFRNRNNQIIINEDAEYNGDNDNKYTPSENKSDDYFLAAHGYTDNNDDRNIDPDDSSTGMYYGDSDQDQAKQIQSLSPAPNEIP